VGDDWRRSRICWKSDDAGFGCAPGLGDGGEGERVASGSLVGGGGGGKGGLEDDENARGGGGDQGLPPGVGVAERHGRGG
jgi:hypothetical protein